MNDTAADTNPVIKIDYKAAEDVTVQICENFKGIPIYLSALLQGCYR